MQGQKGKLEWTNVKIQNYSFIYLAPANECCWKKVVDLMNLNKSTRRWNGKSDLQQHFSFAQLTQLMAIFDQT